jgi:hypothetical protein
MRRKKKRTERQKAVDKLDNIFSKYIRLKHSNNWITKCYTCDKEMERKKIQNWHFISRKYAIVRRDEENCRPQCVWCNIFLSWNYIEYTRRLIDEVWIEKVDELRGSKYKTRNFKVYELNELIEKYDKEVLKLKKALDNQW